MAHIRSMEVLLADPLRAVRAAFTDACGAADDHASLSKSDWGVRALFEKCVSENISQIPQINTVPLDSIPANSLVRFHGMVQDMFDVEYYIGMHKEGGVWHTNKYTDSAGSIDLENLEHDIWERRILYCVPVPGENEWVKQERCSSVPPAKDRTQRSKRHHDSLDSVEPEDMECDASSEENKRMKTQQPADSQQQMCAPKWNTELNMLDKDAKQHPCLVKMYDGSDANLKLNDVAEIIGVLSYDPVLILPNPSTDMLSVSESFLEDDISVQLPASKVPRLHCILVRKLPSPYQLPQQPSVPALDVSSTRETLLVYLTSVLGGDRLAADYLLLHLLSKVHTRVEPVAVGKLSLNLSGCQGGGGAGALSPFAASVSKAISMLLPRSHILNLSLGDLNTSSLAPRKDYSTNRLVTGALQLAAGTHLTLDETALCTGQLSDIGLKNLQVLKNLVQNQKVEYDFEFYNMEVVADVPVLVVSTAKSGLFPADALVPLKMTTAASEAHPSEADLVKWRMYMSCAREGAHIIEPSMQKMVEDDLVAARQRDRSVGPDTFHKWLTMARLVSLSFGEASLTSQRWEMVKNMEMRCAARLGALTLA